MPQPKLCAFELNSREGLHQIDTTRSFPRTLRSAFPLDYRESAIGIAGPAVIRTRAAWWVRLLRAGNLVQHIRDKRQADEYQRSAIAEHASMQVRYRR